MDSELDEFLKKQGVTLVQDQGRNIGSMIKAGIDHSNGTIISFLDDDDLFEPDKIARVVSAFDSCDLCVYYHNYHTVIDSSGKTVNLIYMGNVKETTKISAKDSSLEELSRVNRLSGGFNMSSISVRAALVKGKCHTLERLSYLQDTFFFLLALESGGVLMIDPYIGTKYRLHGSVSNYQGTLMQYVSNSRNVWENTLANFDILEEIVSTDRTKELFRYLLEDSRISKLTVSPLSTFKECFQTMVSYANSCARIGSYELGKIALIVLRMISPLLSSAVYSIAKSSKKPKGAMDKT